MGESNVSWRVLEYDSGGCTKRSIEFHLNHCDVNVDEDLDVGDTVLFKFEGKDILSTLVASSTMGMTTMDLFSDILVEEADLRRFLEGNSIETSGSTGKWLLIQAYLLFTKLTKENAMNPLGEFDSEVECDILEVEIKEEPEDIEDICFDDVRTPLAFQPNSENSSSEENKYLPKPRLRKRKINKKAKAKKMPKINPADNPKDNPEEDLNWSDSAEKVKNLTTGKSAFGNRKVKDKKDKMEDVIKTCAKCGNFEHQVHLDQKDFEILFSEHLWTAHGEKDELMIFDEYYKGLAKIHKHTPTIQVGAVAHHPCPVAYCKESFAHLTDFLDHAEYHKKLRSKKLEFKKHIWPCSECEAVFISARDVRLHIKHEHPPVCFHCRICDKEFNCRENRQIHFNRVHRMDGVHMCDTCGKNFNTEKKLRCHARDVHPSGPGVTCDVCGKHFKSHAKMRHHSRLHREPSRQCSECPEKFMYKKGLTAHLVRDHGHQRKFHCEVCGSEFMHPEHFKRHMNIHSSTPEHKFVYRGLRSTYTKAKDSEPSGSGVPNNQQLQQSHGTIQIVPTENRQLPLPEPAQPYLFMNNYMSHLMN